MLCNATAEIKRRVFSFYTDSPQDAEILGTKDPLNCTHFLPQDIAISRFPKNTVATDYSLCHIFVHKKVNLWLKCEQVCQENGLYAENIPLPKSQDTTWHSPSKTSQAPLLKHHSQEQWKSIFGKILEFLF